MFGFIFYTSPHSELPRRTFSFANFLANIRLKSISRSTVKRHKIHKYMLTSKSNINHPLQKGSYLRQIQSFLSCLPCESHHHSHTHCKFCDSFCYIYATALLSRGAKIRWISLFWQQLFKLQEIRCPTLSFRISNFGPPCIIAPTGISYLV